MLLSKIEEKDLNIQTINQILYSFPEDDLKGGDCILVFGCKKIEERVRVAVKLYNEKRAPYLLFTGGLGKEGIVPEAIRMKEMAISLGVPQEAILTEEQSNNTIENVLCSLLVLERQFLLQNIHRLLIVSHPFHLQRVRLTLSRYMPKWIEYSYCYDKNSNFTKENWIKHERTRNIVEKEAKGILFYAKEGYIDDLDIEGI